MKANILQTKKALLALFAMLMPLLASSHDFEIDGIYYRVTSSASQTVSVTYKGESSNSYYNEYYGDVTIPSTITYEGTTYKVMSIEDDAFYNCIGLESINISEGVTSIGNYAFYGCKSLITTIIPNSVENIGNDAFLGCAGELIVNCNIPSGGINTGVFRYCNFSKVTIGSKVTSIGEYAFHGCRNITSITIPEGVVSIGSSAFRECKNLVSITISESVTSIGSMVFGECTSLTSITIPENSKLESIGMNTFSGCNSLTSIIIPKSVTNIEGNIFSSCNNLSSIVIAEGNSTYDSRDNCNAIIKTRINQIISGCSTTIIPKSVTSIGEGAFRNCSSLTEITIPEGVTSIGNRAFSYCDSLITISIPENVTNINNEVFHGCSSLTTINIPEGVTSIGSSAFEDCSSLISITIPEGVTNIGTSAFNGCTNLAFVIIPESVNSIGQYAFSDCIGEIYINCNIPSAINSSKGTFYNCDISKVVIGDKVTMIGSYAFYQCKNLTTIVLPEKLSDISSQAFAYCEELTDVYCYAVNVPIAVASAFSGSYLEYATLHVPANALNAYKTTAPWSSFGDIVVLEDEEPLEKCATPTISYVDGKVILTCDTEDATIRSSVRDNNIGDYEVTEYNVIPTYTITAYATKSKYENSNEVTLTICWVPCTEEHESEDTGILTIPSKPVLISARDGVLTLSGLAEGTEVTLYTTDGAKVAQQQSSAGEARFTVDTNQVYLVHIGDKVVKIGM